MFQGGTIIGIQGHRVVFQYMPIAFSNNGPTSLVCLSVPRVGATREKLSNALAVAYDANIMSGISIVASTEFDCLQCSGGGAGW